MTSETPPPPPRLVMILEGRRSRRFHRTVRQSAIPAVSRVSSSRKQRLQTHEECSAAAGQSLCRSITLKTNELGEVESEQTASDDGSAETKLNVVYGRDDFGNITSITANDEYGHTRVSTTVYEPEGIFPKTTKNAAGHVTTTEFDATRNSCPFT